MKEKANPLPVPHQNAENQTKDRMGHKAKILSPSRQAETQAPFALTASSAGKNGIALIFSGGGARGAFEYGVWKALRELETTASVNGISGTSIGALNTFFYIQKDFYKAGDIWRCLTTEDIIRINPSFPALLWKIIKAYPFSLKNLPGLLKIIPLLKSFSGFLDNVTLRQILEASINMIKIGRNQLDTYICCTKLGGLAGLDMEPVYFDIKNQPYTKEELVNIGMASSAIYPFFNKIEIDGAYYIDGGFTDNTPILPLYKAGYRKFIVIYLSNHNSVSQRSDTQYPPSAGIPPSPFSDASFVNIRPSAPLPTGKDTTLYFNHEFIETLINDGYTQTMELSAEILKLENGK